MNRTFNFFLVTRTSFISAIASAAILATGAQAGGSLAGEGRGAGSVPRPDISRGTDAVQRAGDTAQSAKAQATDQAAAKTGTAKDAAANQAAAARNGTDAAAQRSASGNGNAAGGVSTPKAQGARRPAAVATSTAKAPRPMSTALPVPARNDDPAAAAPCGAAGERLQRISAPIRVISAIALRATATQPTWQTFSMLVPPG